MKPITAIIVFFSLMIPALCLSWGNYSATKEYIIEDVNQALAKTIQTRNCNRITNDTIQAFRANLTMAQLKESSYLSLCTDEPSRSVFCSDTMIYRTGNEIMYIRAYPNCSKAAVFWMSEQELPLMLFVCSLLWGLFSFVYMKKKGETEVVAYPVASMIEVGTLSFSESENLFYNDRKEAVYFTPMQLQLMKMFMESENHQLSVDDICNKLWPGKDNAKETLYTLIRRLKPIVEKNSNVRIVAEKGHYYALRTDE
ncbi:winged helix-turn-helix domain-containing protein [uncultured Bacteroides sp.]|uniref:winged helix-turn-helix domain-containing protein n=1 Tax=uncultured Bacteroides sp. TaxID=162156 RepID=UPI002603D98F|nr:winged helix-turn-helix domain-containing protein [uncultured Bacteroides sp.]